VYILLLQSPGLRKIIKIFKVYIQLYSGEEYTMILLLSESLGSTLLKEKFTYRPTRKKCGNGAFHYYKHNVILNQWLKWDIDPQKKLFHALEIAFEDYVVWNIELVQQLFLAHKNDHYIRSFGFLHYACKGGSRKLIDLLFSKKLFSQRDWCSGLFGACMVGNIEIAQLMIEFGANDWNNALYGACLGGCIELVQLMLENGANKLGAALRAACENTNMSIIELLITKGADDWNGGLAGACGSGNMTNIELMVAKGATNWNNALYWACFGGKIQAIEFLITRGATDWNRGLSGAFSARRTDIVNLMIARGANNQESILGLLTVPPKQGRQQKT